MKLLVFVVTLGVAVQFVAGVMAEQAGDASMGLLLMLGASFVTLAYASIVSFRRGVQRGKREAERSGNAERA